MKIFYLPDLGEGLAEAEVREWYVKVGDLVKIDQPLVSMETAKAVVDVPSPYDGKIIELHGNPTDIIATGSPLISFESEEATEKPKGSVVGALEESTHKWDDNVIIGNAAVETKKKTIKAMPAARVLASELNIDLAQVVGTGPQGLITPQDVKKLIAKKEVASSPLTHDEKTEKLHGVRRSMAIAMKQSHQEIVPVTIIDDANISHITTGSDVTALLLQAIAKAVKEEPSLNAWFDGERLERKLFKEVNIGIALDSAEGLFVPVIKNVEDKDIKELRSKIDEFKVSVKSRSIPQDQFHGATITLSNFGTIAGKYATPIIVPPTVAILGCGRSREVPTVENDKITIAKILPLSLTFDHRAVTGGEATRFLASVIKHLK